MIKINTRKQNNVATVSFKVNEQQHEFLERKQNKSKYLKKLVDKEIKKSEKG